MTKRRSINIIIFLCIILVIGLLASFVSFTYPLSINGNYYRYSSFVNELVLGADISDGVAITFRADLPSGEAESQYDDFKSSTILQLETILQDAGYKDSSVTSLGTDKIYVEVGNANTYQDKQEVISLIGQPEKIKFSKNSDANTSDNSDIAGKYVESVSVKSQDNGNATIYYVDIKFDKKGKEKLKSLSQTIVSESGTLYMYLGDTAISSSSLEETITDGHITMYSEDNFIDKKTTLEYANTIKKGLLDLDLVQLEATTITPTLGKNIQTMIVCALVLVVLASFVYLLIRYSTLGLMGIFNLLFFVVLGLGILQSIPFMHVNFGGVIGLALGYVLALSGVVTICEKARNEYKTGKKLHTCFKLAQKNSLAQIIISNAFVFVAGVVCALLPTMSIQSFGMTSFVLSLIAIFSSTVMFRLMLKLYTGLNAFNSKKCNFVLGEGDKNAK